MADAAFLVVGLGNPGAKYALTRHNIGFMCIDALAETHGISLKAEKAMNALMGQGRIQGQKVILLEPQTYMNLSGDALVKAMGYFKIPIEQVLVAYDDVALPFGKIRLRPDGSAGSHNGMKSVIGRTGTAAVPRLRIGVNEAPPQWDLADYVLANFTPQEQEALPTILRACRQAVEMWLDQGMVPAMNHFNSLALLNPS